MALLQQPPKVITLAITGASGAPYALRLLQCLVQAGCQVNVLVSAAAQVVLATETDWQIPGEKQAQAAYLARQVGAQEGQIRVYGKQQWMAPVASGAGAGDAMVVCPCSTGSLSAIANGASDNLIERAADVHLKERRALILVPREAPYSAIHLEHMLKLTQMGALIIPASPGFYHQPQSINDLVDFIVARILNQLCLPQTLLPAWGENDA
ncbi:MAG: flavin prenyltransferase UbiX [Gammaproteobacteria bacterium]|jgi:4-hydroxy-3-polyprenylbenzoate decarboxylase|nr:flavin prenyltransferase UbiX [Gammaproteobacteria bacterium]